MRTAIRILGFLTLFFIFLGTLFKLQHWPGASIFLILGNLSLVTGFLPIFFIDRINKSETGIDKAVNIIALISISMIFLGGLFKVQHWPGASLMLIFGNVIFTFIGLPLFIFSRTKKPDKKIIEIGALVLIGLYVSMFLTLTALKYGRDILTTYVKLGEQQQNSIELLDRIIDKRDSQIVNKSGELSTIEQRIDGALGFINETKAELIRIADGDYDVESKINNPELIMRKDNIDIPNFVMVGSTFGSSGKRGEYLKTVIIELKTLMLDFVETNDFKNKEQLTADIEKILNTEDSENWGRILPWEMEMFYYTPLSGTIAILTGIEHDIKTTELLIKDEIVFEQR